MKKKVILVFGTRPEAIKMAPLVKVFEKEKSFFETIVCVTGQHKEMLTQVLDIFKIRPKYNLEIMKKNQTLFDINNEVLIGMKNIYEAENPDVALVHGDTSTTYAAALAAFYMNIDVGHVEAGLRTYNVYEPFPEEFNRQAVSIFAKYNFSPTKRTQENLLREGKNP